MAITFSLFLPLSAEYFTVINSRKSENIWRIPHKILFIMNNWCEWTNFAPYRFIRCGWPHAMFALFNYDQFHEKIENTLQTFLPLCSKYSLTLWPQFHHHLPHRDNSMVTKHFPHFFIQMEWTVTLLKRSIACFSNIFWIIPSWIINEWVLWKSTYCWTT